MLSQEESGHQNFLPSQRHDYVETKYELHAAAQVAAVLDSFRTLSRVRNTCKDCAAGPWWLARMCSPPLRYHEYDCMTCVDVEKSQLCVLPFIL